MKRQLAIGLTWAIVAVTSLSACGSGEPERNAGAAVPGSAGDRGGNGEDFGSLGSGDLECHFFTGSNPSGEAIEEYLRDIPEIDTGRGNMQQVDYVALFQRSDVGGIAPVQRYNRLVGDGAQRITRGMCEFNILVLSNSARSRSGATSGNFDIVRNHPSMALYAALDTCNVVQTSLSKSGTSFPDYAKSLSSVAPTGDQPKAIELLTDVYTAACPEVVG